MALALCRPVGLLLALLLLATQRSDVQGARRIHKTRKTDREQLRRNVSDAKLSASGPADAHVQETQARKVHRRGGLANSSRRWSFPALRELAQQNATQQENASSSQTRPRHRTASLSRPLASAPAVAVEIHQLANGTSSESHPHKVVGSTLGPAAPAGSNTSTSTNATRQEGRQAAAGRQAINLHAAGSNASVHAGKVKQSPDQLADIFAQSNPDEIMAALFILLGGLYCCKVICLDVAGADHSEKVRHQREKVTKNYNTIVKEMVVQLKEVRSSTAMLAELNFRGQARHFQQFMNDLARTPERFLGSDFDEVVLLEQFRAFTRHWLKVFEQCSLQPRKEPRRIVTEAQMRSCGTIKELAEYVSKRMVANPVVFISSCSELIDQTNQLSSSPERVRTKSRREESGMCCCCCCCLCSWIKCRWGLNCCLRKRNRAVSGDPFPAELNMMCLSLRFMSWTHVRVVVAVLMGGALTAFLYLQQKLILAMGTSGVCLLLVVILFYIEEIDTRCRLEAQIKLLKDQHAKVEQSLSDISSKFTKMAALENLWQYRTQPQLELFRGLSDHLADTPKGDKATFLAGVAESLEKLEHAMGDLWMWVGSGAFDVKHLKMIGDQLQDIAHFMAGSDAHTTQAILERLNNVFGFLTVRVIACHSLTNKGRAIFGEVSDPYVTVRIGKDQSRMIRTQTIQDSLNPVWIEDNEQAGECEFLPLKANERMLEMEVWDENFRADDVGMGYLHVDFKSGAPGLWHRKRSKLYSFRTKQHRGHGEIDFEFYYANCLWLLHTSWNHNPQARSAVKPRRSQENVIDKLSSVRHY